MKSLTLLIIGFMIVFASSISAQNKIPFAIDSSTTAERISHVIFWKDGKAGLYDTKQNKTVLPADWDFLISAGIDYVIGQQNDKLALIDILTGKEQFKTTDKELHFSPFSNNGRTDYYHSKTESYSRKKALEDWKIDHDVPEILDYYAYQLNNGKTLIGINDIREVPVFDNESGEQLFDDDLGYPIYQDTGGLTVKIFNKNSKQFERNTYTQTAKCPGGFLISKQNSIDDQQVGILDYNTNYIVDLKPINKWTKKDSALIFGSKDIYIQNSLEQYHTTYIKNGKMGLVDLNLYAMYFVEYLTPKYDFIMPYFCVIKDGKMYLLDNDQKIVTDMVAQKKMTLHSYYGDIAATIDDSFYNLNYEDGVLKHEKRYESSDGKPISEILKLNKDQYIVFIDSRETYSVSDEDGEPEYDEEGYPIYEETGVLKSGIYDTKKQSWIIPPNFSFISAINNGFIAHSDTAVFFIDKKFKSNILTSNRVININKVVEHLLPQNSSLFETVNDDQYLYFQNNHKVGVFTISDFQNDLPDIILPARYDYIAFCNELGVFVTASNGKLSFKKEASYSKDNPFPNITFRSVSIGSSSYQTYYDLLIIDGDTYKINNSTDDYKWEKQSEKTKPTSIRFHVEIATNGDIISNINNRITQPDYDEETGEEMYDDYGDPVYVETGIKKAGIYNYKKRKWILKDYSNIERCKKGFIVEKERALFSTDFHFGFVSSDFKYKSEVMYRNLLFDNNYLLYTDEDSIGVLNLKGEKLFDPFPKVENITIKGGYIFAAKGQKHDSNYESYIYDNNGDPVYTDEIIKTIKGEDIIIEYAGVHLFDNGILMIKNDEEYDDRIGFYDLKTKKILVEPIYKTPNQLSGNSLWLSKDGLWNFATIEEPVKINNTDNYENVTPFVVDETVYYKVKKNDLLGLVTSQNKKLLPIAYDNIFLNTDSETENTYFIVKRNNKFGLYSIKHKKLILECAYDYVALGTEKEVYVQTKTGYGAFLFKDIDKSGNYKWSVVPTHPEKINFNVSNGWVETVINGKYGRVDLSGKEIVKQAYHSISKVSSNDEHEAFSKVGKANGSITLYGVYKNYVGEIVPCEYSRIKAFGYGNSNNLLISKFVDGIEKYGLWDIALNKEIIPCEYETVNKRDLYYEVFKNHKKGIYSLEGVLILDASYSQIELLNDYLTKSYNDYIPQQFFVLAKNGKKGVFDMKRNEIILPVIYDAFSFYNFEQNSNNEITELLVSKDNKWGAIDLESKKVTIPLIYDEATEINDFLRLKKGAKYEIMNAKHETLLKEISSFSAFNYFIKIKQGDSIYILTHELKDTVYKEQLDDILAIQGIYITYRNGKQGALTDDFKEIIPTQYDKVSKINAYNDLILYGNYSPWSHLDKTLTVGGTNVVGKNLFPLQYKVSLDENQNPVFTKDGKKYILDVNNNLIDY